MATGRTPAFNRRAVATCRHCPQRKGVYRTRAEARTAARIIHPTEKMHAYECNGYWHFGHDELWREIPHDDLIWKPLPDRARRQMLDMARATFLRGAAA